MRRAVDSLVQPAAARSAEVGLDSCWAGSNGNSPLASVNLAARYFLSTARDRSCFDPLGVNCLGSRRSQDVAMRLREKAGTYLRDDLLSLW